MIINIATHSVVFDHAQISHVPSYYFSILPRVESDPVGKYRSISYRNFGDLTIVGSRILHPHIVYVRFPRATRFEHTFSVHWRSGFSRIHAFSPFRFPCTTTSSLSLLNFSSYSYIFLRITHSEHPHFSHESSHDIRFAIILFDTFFTCYQRLTQLYNRTE